MIEADKQFSFSVTNVFVGLSEMKQTPCLVREVKTSIMLFRAHSLNCNGECVGTLLSIQRPFYGAELVKERASSCDMHTGVEWNCAGG
jgi:hypothetical protein